MILRTLSCIALAATLLGPPAQASGLDALSNKDASSGVKEALRNGADYAVTSLGSRNGFLDNRELRIPLPDSLRKVSKSMRALGMGKQAEELEITINHAAEAAVAGAKPVLVESITKMTINDAKAILTGGNEGVTDYFRRSSSAVLELKFKPIVKAATQKLKLGAQYNKFAGKAANLGLLDEKDADLDSYVTQKAMDGLFAMIAVQEKNLRSNPMQAGSALLKSVFGAL